MTAAPAIMLDTERGDHGLLTCRVRTASAWPTALRFTLGVSVGGARTVHRGVVGPLSAAGAILSTVTVGSAIGSAWRATLHVEGDDGSDYRIEEGASGPS